MKHLLLPATLIPALALAEPSFEPWSYTEKDLFPSAIVSTATVDWNGDEETAEDRKSEDDQELGKHDLPIYGDENGWLAVNLTDVPRGAKVSVEIAIDGFLKPSRWTGTLDKVTSDGEAQVFPKGAWDFTALLKVKQQQPVTATFKVTVNGKDLPEQNETCLMRSINDCPFYVLWDEEGEDYDDFSWLFAAYVNENHPLVDGILKDALKSGLVDSFTGYQSDDGDEVLTQVFAIWNVLQRRGIKYSDISTTTPSKYVVSQTVRFLDQSVGATQANCVDGTVLMASVLRKIGINPYLVMVPGHCFLAFDLGKGDDADIVGLETTMLGQDNLKPVAALDKLPAKVRQKEFEKSFQTFANAIETGTEALEKHADAFENGEDPDTQMISVAEARELGIMPIASGSDRP